VSPLSFKCSLVNCLIFRIYSIASNWQNFYHNITILFGYLKDNGYPINFLSKILKNNCNNIFCTIKLTKTKPEFSNYISLPYLGKISDNFKINLMKFYKSKNLPIQVIFKTKKLCSYFPIKDRSPKVLMSGIVYEFKCPFDKDISYIGKTTRHLTTRIKEHTKHNSLLCNHFLSCNCLKNAHSNFNILDFGSSDFDVKVKESLLILKHKPCLNVQVNQGAEFTVKIFC